MKNILILFVVLFIFACDSDDSLPVTIGPINPNQDDTTPPSISIPRGSDIIEVLTDLNFSVSDASDVIETVLTLDGTQVLETTETAFNFQIDPFDFDDGEKTLVITAEDEAGNQAEAQLVFTTQKLLFSASDFRGQLSTAEK
ncbi:MAG: Ig-like domain-containing protein, partial [Bacteroidota bacterium]